MPGGFFFNQRLEVFSCLAVEEGEYAYVFILRLLVYA